MKKLLENRTLFATKLVYVEHPQTGEIVVLKGSPHQWLARGFSIKEMSVTWRRLTWGEQNDIYARSLRPNGEMDWFEFRQNKLKSCLRSWDLVDEHGKAIPCNAEKIDLLRQEIAEGLLQQYEVYGVVSGEDVETLGAAAKKFLTGKWKPKEDGILPRQVTEHILAKTYGWTIDYILSLDAADVDVYVYLCLLGESLDREFELQTAGFGGGVNAATAASGGRPMKREKMLSFNDGYVGNDPNADFNNSKENGNG